MRYETENLHTGVEICPETGASSVPIYQASTFHQFDWDAPPKYDYARSGNPTRSALEKMVARLEGATAGFAFASGMAAITSVLMTLSTGSHIIACEDVYGGSFRALTTIFARLGIETSFVDATDLCQVDAAIRPNTRMLFLESPSNPTLRIVDLEAASVIAKAHGLITVVDNTFMSPYLQRPHRLGIDVVVHSATKFLAGHSDVVAGVATVQDESFARELYLIQNGLGSVLGPHDCWLVMRGIKTLALRMRQSQTSAIVLAKYLEQHHAVRRVYYPGLAEHAGRVVHMRQSDGPGAVLSFELAGAAAARRFVESVQLPLFAVSLGAVESILSYPVRMSHASMPAAERERRGISDGLLRLSVGLEDVNDLLDDFAQALKRA